MSKKTVGIITIHKSNFGGCLQSYALWAFITSIGYKCEIIDLYRPVMSGYKNEKSHLTFSTCKKAEQVKNLKQLAKKYFSLLRNIIKPNITKYNFTNNANFLLFNSLIKYSAPYYSIDSLYINPPHYDIYISGSDQIWNPDMPFENEPYLLTFAPSDKKRIAYASSFGRQSLPDEFKKHYKNCLEKYNSISVREASGQKIIEELGELESDLVLDPTMLFDSEYWHTISSKPNIKQRYLFCFSLNNNIELLTYASKICKKNNLALVIISNEKHAFEGVISIIKPDSGPKEWLGFIENAEYVITDSFHGSVFSILFKKSFLSYTKKENREKYPGSRIENLFELLSLKSCLIEDFNHVPSIKDSSFQYELLEEKIHSLRKYSQNYLLKCFL